MAGHGQRAPHMPSARATHGVCGRSTTYADVVVPTCAPPTHKHASRHPHARAHRLRYYCTALQSVWLMPCRSSGNNFNLWHSPCWSQCCECSKFESIARPWPHGRASKAAPADGSDGRPSVREGKFLLTYCTCRLLLAGALLVRSWHVRRSRVCCCSCSVRHHQQPWAAPRCVDNPCGAVVHVLDLFVAR